MTNYNELRDGQEFYANGYKKGYEDAKKEFERPHGEWVVDIHTRDVVCSNCRQSRRDTRTTHIFFCNHCGADMRNRKRVRNEH